MNGYHVEGQADLDQELFMRRKKILARPSIICAPRRADICWVNHDEALEPSGAAVLSSLPWRKPAYHLAELRAYLVLPSAL